MSTAVITNPIFECAELFKNVGSTSKQAKENSIQMQGQQQQSGNGHTPLRRSYTSLVSLIEQHRKLDRSVSEPTSRYKTELCRPFEESGSCKYGDKCQFAHGYGELRNLARHPKYKTELCRTFHKIGFCPYGPRCHFVHNFEEARIHNLKVSAQLQQQSQQQQRHNLVAGLGPLLQPLVNVSLLEQLAASPQVVAAVTATSDPGGQLTRTNSLGLASYQQQHEQSRQHQTLHRSSSLGIPLPQLAHARPKPLNLSPTFSLGSAADSISPSSSLSQSPTNSMASFFSDESSAAAAPSSTCFGGYGFLGQPSQSPSPLDELSSRTPSPLSPGAESRLPVFNRISSTIAELEHLKI